METYCLQSQKYVLSDRFQKKFANPGLNISNSILGDGVRGNSPNFYECYLWSGDEINAGKVFTLSTLAPLINSVIQQMKLGWLMWS